MEHGPPPDHGLVGRHQHAHGDDLDPEGLGRDHAALFADLRTAADAEHLRDVGSVHVRVHQPHARPLGREGEGEVHGGGGFPHPALARAHGDDVADPGNGLAAEAGAGAHVCGHGGARHRDSGQAAHDPLRLRLHLVAHGAGGSGQLDGEVHLAAGDLDVLDEAQGDDVLVEIGIAHGAQGGEDLVRGDAHGTFFLR